MGNQSGNQLTVGRFLLNQQDRKCTNQGSGDPMLFRKHIVSMRTLLQLTAATGFFVGGVGAAVAANSGIAPLLVPYTINVIAGNPQFPAGTTSLPAGYAGEGIPATPTPTKAGATLDAPYSMAVDSVGNVYISDTGNFIIREVNAQTGLITTIAGVPPKGCSGTNCTLRTSGCSDGVPAFGSPIGIRAQGIAVDAYGNVYFVDNNTSTVSVIYRGGTQVAAFITLENPGGVAKSGGSVQPGYLYHVAGTVDLNSCAGTVGNTDNVLAFQSATLRTPGQISLDGAGNIYIADGGNSTVRVINTQATPQTFFQYTVQPGFIRAITNCSAALTTPCPTTTTTNLANTGINGPLNALVFNSQWKTAMVDAYGNVYQLNGTGGGTGPPGIYAPVGYAGGTPLTNLLTAEAPSLAASYTSPSELPLTYGNAYIIIGNPAIGSALPGSFPDVLVTQNASFDIRPASIRADIFGTFWFMDTHYPELNRIDQYTSLATLTIFAGRAKANIAPLNNSPASFSNPYYCVYGNAGSNLPWKQGPQTFDPLGDGCPASVATMGGSISSGPDTVSDGLGNIYLPDDPNQVMRELPLGNAFPPTAVGTPAPVTQAIQVHFSASNGPVVGAQIPDAAMTGLGVTTTAFSISPASSDFSINTTTPEFPLGSLINSGSNAYNYSTATQNFAMWAGLPTCTQLGLYPTATVVQDYDCLVYVTFNPTAPGIRQGQLLATTSNGSVYNFSLSGVGVGGQLAIDGGTPTVVPTTGLGTTAGIAVAQSGTIYIADPSNNRIVVEPAGGGPQTTIGTGLKGPMGVALDSAGNVYISDTGNNRVLTVNAITGAQTVLGNYVWIPGNAATAPPQYAFKAPQGLAVDAWNNVYVADTGNAAVVEIPSDIKLGGAVPLLAYAGAPKFVNPVAVAVDSKGNIYVADTRNATAQVVELPPGGGDLVTVPTSQFPNSIGSGLSAPNGVAVDAAGNVYVSDSGNNNVVEVPAASGPGSTPFALNFPGVSSPAGLSLDANGNLYVADSGNKQILFDNRQNPVVDFGIVPQALSSPPSQVMTVTNIGSQPVTLVAPFTTVSSVNPATNTAFTITNNSCAAGALAGGLTCSVTANFNPTTNGRQGENVTVNGSSQSIMMTANGEQPLANVVLTAGYSTGTTPTAGATATITATVTQPHITGDTPTGSVVFNYTILGDGTTGTQTVNLVGSSGTATASFPLPTLLQGRRYTINATYISTDAQTTGTTATPLVIYVPGIAVTVTAASVSFTYGGAVPAITGTVTPDPTASGVTYKFTSAATSSTPIGTYPIQVVFSGGNYLNYGFPPAVDSTGAPAVVKENPAPLTYKIPNFTAQYGALPISYGANAVVTGAVNGDSFGASFTPANSQLLNAGTYSVVPKVLGAHVGNYTVTAPPSTLTITQAPAGITVGAALSSVLNTSANVTGSTIAGSTSVTGVSSTAGLVVGEPVVGSSLPPGATITVIDANDFTISAAALTTANGVPISAGVATATYQIFVNSLVPSGIGIASGTVSVTDNFTPITLTAPGTGSPAAPVTTVLPLTAGSATFTPTSTTPGTHFYSFAYSGDSNFQCSVFGQAKTSTCPSTGTITTNLIVDNPDFTVTSTTGVVNIIPGVAPSGNGLPPAANQSTAAPETAIISIAGVLGFTGQVALTCATQHPTYINCSMTPPVVSLTASGNGTSTASILSVWTPATLPLGFSTSQNRMSTSKTVLAFLPFGFLAFCVRRRRRLSKALWMLIAIAAVSAGMSGCGGNQVDFFTPVPTGPQTVTVTATFTGSATVPAQTRTLVVPISIN
jgi:sugar lactone lactonase YvrE